MEPIVIIGSGLAGVSFARQYRKLERNAPLVMVTADDGGFYSKPSLSGALAGRKTAQKLLLKNAAALRRELNATLLTDVAIVRIDTASQVVSGPSGELGYSRLVLALGSDPARLPLAGWRHCGPMLGCRQLGGRLLGADQRLGRRRQGGRRHGGRRCCC